MYSLYLCESSYTLVVSLGRLIYLSSLGTKDRSYFVAAKMPQLLEIFRHLRRGRICPFDSKDFIRLRLWPYATSKYDRPLAAKVSLPTPKGQSEYNGRPPDAKGSLAGPQGHSESNCRPEGPAKDCKTKI
ncbi:unnamed protein product [Meganyctiphanes norvegica]|uniref:Uncharacterized protein n=1 Tax=Meganyctiphanes norvegica TaxID=48144 RepID=A0AAV2QHA7_MEGNR